MRSSKSSINIGEVLQSIANFLILLFKNKKRNSNIKPEFEEEIEDKIIKRSENLPQNKQDQKKPVFLDLVKDRDKITKMASRYGLNAATVLAVAEVESAGRSGFQKTGLLTVLFEAHKFYAALKKAGLDPDILMIEYPNLISPVWNRKLYKGGDQENSRLADALKIHECALDCASYGMFQIMGFNHKACGFDTSQEFVEYLKTGQEAHIDAFLKFVSDNPRRLNALKNKDWAIFARLYNGPGYAQNKYDIKIAKAYELYSKNV